MSNVKLTKVSQDVISYAQQKGVLMYSPQCVEVEIDNDSNHRRAGFSAEDVTGFYKPESIKEYLNDNIENWTKAYLEFGFFTAFRFLCLSIPWSGWVWTVDSTRYVANEIVDDRLASLPKKQRQEEMKNYNLLVKAISDEQIYAYLNANYLKLGNSMWVQENDPSVIYYDPKLKPYALADGWNQAQMGEILSEWLELAAGVKLPVKYIENASW